MTHTQNYNLTQWSPEDRILRKDFNTDNAAIDTALADHAAAIAKRGNCSVEVFSYTGTGTCGAEHPTVIHFRAVPKAYFILGGILLASWGGASSANISTVNNSAVNTSVGTIWTGSTLQIISTNIRYQANFLNGLYTVVAFYAEDAEA